MRPKEAKRAAEACQNSTLLEYRINFPLLHKLLIKVINMKVINVVIFTAICLFQLNVSAQTMRSAESFGAIANDSKDDTKALCQAAKFCRENPNTTLTLSKGVYILKNELAIKTEKAAMADQFGGNPEGVVFKPYYAYGKGLDFAGAINTTLKASGATIMCEGWMEPVSIEGCENFMLEGLTIDYKNKPFSAGIVTDVTPKYFDVQFSNERIIDNKMPLGRMTFWDKQDDRLLSDVLYYPEREILEGNLVRFHRAVSPSALGCVANILHGFHFRPAILIHRSTNTVIRDVTIHSQAGMGVVGFDSKDILLERLAIRPAAGYYQSTNTDATHFACCSGLLRFDDCYFEAQGDDATNVHGYYHSILSKNGKILKTKLNAPTFTHIQVMDVPRAGDVLELVNTQTLEVVDVLTVISASADKSNFVNTVELNKEIPENVGDYYVMNISKLPRLEFVNSVINSHLARGILVKTRNVLIENNRMNYCTGTAIHVGAESGWAEGTHSANVVIKNNVMIGCGSGSGGQGGASGIAVIIDAKNTDNSYLHKNVTIVDNIIIGNDNGCGIYLGNAKDVKISGNHVSNCRKDMIINVCKDVKIGK